jgi:hypothetical protein
LPVDWVPFIASLPPQALEAVHEVALVEDHESVAAFPFVTVLGLALNVTVGAGEVTVTVADCAAVPPAPLQVSVYVVIFCRAPVERDPLMPTLPDQPPEAVQALALVVDQFKVELAPLATVLGLALRLTVGAGVAGVTDTVAACVALPPAPVQVSE